MKMKNISGIPARGSNYFNRPKLSSRFKEKIRNGCNILISAPRRVGKTSLMLHICDEGLDGFHSHYLITEAVKSENEYFKLIYDFITDTEFLSKTRKLSKKVSLTLKGISGRLTKINDTLVLEKSEPINYRDECIRLINTMDLKGQKLLLMIDEFPQTVENIIKNEGELAANQFLLSNRALRLDERISSKLQFVFAGSIGLGNIVSRLNCNNIVTDLEVLSILPLNITESHSMIEKLTEGLPFSLSNSNRDYILEKIGWCIPYYIQLAIQELSMNYDEMENVKGGKQKPVTKNMIDRSFSEMLNDSNYFNHWNSRLKKSYKDVDYSFAKELLNIISKKEMIESKEIINLAYKLNLEDGYREILNTLKHDGYINRDDDSGICRFNSPLLKTWWYKNVAN